jgi:ribosomal protein S18 acetylase RimI-like enzyme
MLVSSFPFLTSHFSCGVDGEVELGVLVVSPDCQRRGIGTALLEEGLGEVDRRGLQCVLAASAKGRGLYKKFGFADFEILEFNLAEYEGGEGCGYEFHAIMHRPAQKGI